MSLGAICGDVNVSSLPDDERKAALEEDQRALIRLSFPLMVYTGIMLVIGLPGNVLVLAVHAGHSKRRTFRSNIKFFISTVALYDVMAFFNGVLVDWVADPVKRRTEDRKTESST
nr:hypothetical protein BaRGS_018214 [Batillaria attramentaria]